MPDDVVNLSFCNLNNTRSFFASCVKEERIEWLHMYFEGTSFPALMDLLIMTNGKVNLNIADYLTCNRVIEVSDTSSQPGGNCWFKTTVKK